MTSGYRAWWQNGSRGQTPIGILPVSCPWKLLARVRVLRQALRLGIHHLWPASDGGIIGLAKGVLIRLEPGRQHFRVVGRLRSGNKPASRGFCVLPDGRVYYGEYCLNMDRSQPIGVFLSRDHGRSYEMVYEFSAGKVRHIHFIQWDPWGKCLWMGTGDADAECLMLCSKDAGETWEQIGGGSQLWRAVGVVFAPEAVYWGTDAGMDAGRTPNYIMRWCRSSHRATPVREVQGPCHGNGGLGGGTVLISTGVERGVNEKDRCAHFWASRDGSVWEELGQWRKDPWPRIVQFGVIHFPPGEQTPSSFWFNCRGLVGHGETTIAAAIGD